MMLVYHDSMPEKKRSTIRNTAEWQRYAECVLDKIIESARSHPELGKRLPDQTDQDATWTVGLRLMGRTTMTQLNAHYRGKDYATDVLSFEAPEVFQAQGHLGELVICLPVLKAQAREMDHSAESELRILLTHGLLHLLGFDHEKGGKQAVLMQSWEEKLLGNATQPSTRKTGRKTGIRLASARVRTERPGQPSSGLIKRAHSGNPIRNPRKR